jgi:hypothetical protein
MENRYFSIDYDGNKYEIATKFRKQGSELLLLLHGLGCSKDSFQDISYLRIFTLPNKSNKETS